MQTDEAARRALDAVYREIPSSSPCKTGCSGCCGPVPWSAVELAAVQADIPATARWIEHNGARGLLDPATGKCPFAVAGGCRVYDRRPFMCRMFAASSDPRLTCPFGSAAKEPLSGERAAELTRLYRKQTEI